MTKDEALKMALEALEFMSHVDSIFANEFDFQINAIKEALANDALEKKAENARELGLNYEPDWTPERIAGMARLKEAQDKKLAQTKQESYWERVARIKEEMLKLAYEENKLLKDFQPQRTWTGLTDEEMQDLWDRYAHMEMMRAIEAKLKEKNT